MTFTMKADDLSVTSDFGKIEDLKGNWINTQGKPRGVARLNISPANTGEAWHLSVQIAGSTSQWMETTFIPHVAPRGQTGFHAHIQIQGQDESQNESQNKVQSLELIVNLKLGILVILSCTRFCDGSGRAGYMLREFFRREQPLPFDPAPVDLPPVNLAPFEGKWIHTAEQAGFVQRLMIVRDGEGWKAQTELSDGRNLGTTPLQSYCDNMGYLAFKGQYELDGGTCVLAANTQSELIVLTSFHRFDAGADERNRAYREIFARAEER